MWSWSEHELQQLGRFLADRGLCGPVITAQAIGDGHSNLTFLVSDGHSRLVVRRPPPPPLPPGAHDVLREARLLTALERTDVPSPRVRAVAAIGELLDVPVYVMDFVDGVVITESTPAPGDNKELRRRIGESLVDTLAALHKVAWREVGLGDFGKPDGFNARQLRRMRSLIAVEGNVPRAFAALDDWLHAHLPPESGNAIVHNDFNAVILGGNLAENSHGIVRGCVVNQNELKGIAWQFLTKHRSHSLVQFFDVVFFVGILGARVAAETLPRLPRDAAKISRWAMSQCDSALPSGQPSAIHK